MIAKWPRLIDSGRIPSMPKIDVTKLAGKKRIEIYVRSWMFRPCDTVVLASRTVEALKSCESC